MYVHMYSSYIGKLPRMAVDELVREPVASERWYWRRKGGCLLGVAGAECAVAVRSSSVRVRWMGDSVWIG